MADVYPLSRIIRSVFGYPDAVIRFRLKYVEVQSGPVAQQLLEVVDDIRIFDRCRHVVSRLHVMHHLVKLEDIHRPWKILKIDMKMPAHKSSFPEPFRSDSSALLRFPSDIKQNMCHPWPRF